MTTTFQERLSKVIEERGLKQKDLAEIAQTTEATISRYFNGERTPHIEVLVSISKSLNVSIDYLLGVSDVPYVNNGYSTEERILVSAYSKANERDTTIIWQLLEPYLNNREKGLYQQLCNMRKEEDA